MYVFAIALMFGLGILVLERFGERFLARIPELMAMVYVGLGIGLAWVVDFDVWRLWGISARAGWVGVTMTGIMLGGLALGWHVVLGFFTGLLRKVNDEAATMEKEKGLRAA